MKTQKELLNEHRKQLDEKFKQQYPDGRFCIQRRSYNKPFNKNIEPGEKCSFALHWVPLRNTSASKHKGISVANRGTYGADGIFHSNHQNSSFGNSKNYDSLDKFMAAIIKYECPQDVSDAFMFRYNNRANEGFVI